MAEKKISPENAQDIFNLLLDHYEINSDDEEDKESIKTISGVLLKAIQYGRLEIKLDDGLKITQHLSNSKILEYEEISGEAKLEMDKYSKQGQYARMYGLIGFLTKEGFPVISKLKGKDSSLVEALATIFLFA
jgi:hypothetical protein